MEGLQYEKDDIPGQIKDKQACQKTPPAGKVLRNIFVFPEIQENRGNEKDRAYSDKNNMQQRRCFQACKHSLMSLLSKTAFKTECPLGGLCSPTG
ncbi:MAG: hypothetical protein ACOY4W_17510 [Thermodesulfobacteriota bacterium]